MADETTQERELGVDHVECPNCGRKLAAVEQGDGAVAYDSCSKCYPKATKAQVKEQAELQAAGAIPGRETGTNTEGASDG